VSAIDPPPAAEQQSSAAAAALSDKKLLKTNIAAAVGCSGWFGLPSVRVSETYKPTCPT
jgi:hypothetical protein